mmetsp:Transcript_57295/g.147372  ORF Transcript_57295/g.147372 Transcript_57295/m.147372 type:complete len:202 (-) Transcript_57295:159-764(-)
MQAGVLHLHILLARVGAAVCGRQPRLRLQPQWSAARLRLLYDHTGLRRRGLVTAESQLKGDAAGVRTFAATTALAAQGWRHERLQRIHPAARLRLALAEVKRLLDLAQVEPPGLEHDGGQDHDGCNHKRQHHRCLDAPTPGREVRQGICQDPSHNLHERPHYCGEALDHDAGAPKVSNVGQNEQRLPDRPVSEPEDLALPI